MRWSNHKIVTAAGVYALTGNVVPTIIASAGSVFPDSIEFVFGLRHRGATHYPYIYLGCLGWLWFWLQHNSTYPAYILFYFCLGAICHLLEDLMSRSGLPLRTPGGKPWGFGFYIIHTTSEFKVVMVSLGILVGIGVLRGYYSGACIQIAVQQMTQFTVGLVRAWQPVLITH